MTKVSLRAEHRMLTRARVLDAARHLFYELGYVATRMEEVAREADLSRTTLYQHFSSKTAIMEAVLDDEIPRFQETMSVLQEVPPDEDRMAIFLRHMWLHYRDNAKFVSILREAVMTEPSIAKRIDESYRETIEILLRYLPRGGAPAEIDDQTRRVRLYICLSAADSMFERCLDPRWAGDRDLILSELVMLWHSMFPN